MTRLDIKVAASRLRQSAAFNGKKRQPRHAVYCRRSLQRPINIDKGATGFTPPLPSGTYSFWVQEASAGTVNYGFNFVIIPAPEPKCGRCCLQPSFCWEFARSGEDLNRNLVQPERD